MPVSARQGMAPGQKNAISTSRQTSTIPKSGAGGTWVYPSPQMFYNSLVRRDQNAMGMTKRKERKKTLHDVFVQTRARRSSATPTSSWATTSFRSFTRFTLPSILSPWCIGNRTWIWWRTCLFMVFLFWQLRRTLYGGPCGWVRKGKAEDCTENDMGAVVSVHNSMNEDTWRRVMTWEKLHCHECRNPMLLRFLVGRAHVD
jgi:hypothetical protein